MVPICYTVLLFFFCRSLVCFAVSNISSSEPLFLNQTLISRSQIFELGFFTYKGSNNQYVGMWYKNITPSKYIWVANRAQPLDYRDQLVSLTIGGDGNLRLLDGAQNAVWSTNVSMGSNRSIAVLLDTGNLVLMDSGSIVWESFDFPTDTLLPGMKIGINIRTGEKRYLISWRTASDPSPGNFSVGITWEIPPQPFIWNGSAPYWRGGQWDKSKFIGTEDSDSYLSSHNVQQDFQQGTAYYTLTSYNVNFFTYMFISSDGSFKWVYWNQSDGNWVLCWEAPQNLCETYGTCGPFGICDSSVSPDCKCLEGFAPKSEEEWKGGKWAGGCTRKKELQCQRDLNTTEAPLRPATNQSDYFLKLSQMKLPDAAKYLIPFDDSAEGCQDWCFNNCSCIAYSYVDNIGCLIWFDEVMDIQSFTTYGKDLFIRLAYDKRSDNTAERNKIIVISLSTILCCIILGAGIYYVICKRRANERESDGTMPLQQIRQEEKDDVPSELPTFNFKSILEATSNFSITNKLGQGGFGPVYKGRLPDGKEVAVKRLSSSSGQGAEEFKNEITLISKLQHRNLVKLMGICIEGEEKILLYEYLPNKSLDTFLFGEYWFPITCHYLGETHGYNPRRGKRVAVSASRFLPKSDPSGSQSKQCSP